MAVCGFKMNQNQKCKKSFEVAAARLLLVSGFESPVSFVVAIRVRADAVSDPILKRSRIIRFRNCIR